MTQEVKKLKKRKRIYTKLISEFSTFQIYGPGRGRDKVWRFSKSKIVRLLFVNSKAHVSTKAKKSREKMTR